MYKKTAIATGVLAMAAAWTAGAAQGVSDTEIVLGLNTDLSGPVANYGKESRNGMNLAVEQINERGGIHGRKIRLVVEDHAYDPRKAIMAAQKLVHQDQVFAVLGTLGTATSMASLPILLDSKVFSFMPQGASKGLYDPPSPYKVALSPSYKPMSEATLDYMLGKKKYERIGVLYQDDDYGREALEGVEAYLKSKDIKLVEKTSYKRGATDFASQMAKLKAANADLVFNASTLREYVGSVNEANKIGFKPDFVGTAANYSQQVPLLGGAGMEGVYAATFITLPSTHSENPAVRQWSEEYQKRFNEEPGLYSMYAYYALSTFAKIAERTGRDLTPETFNAAMEALDLPVDELGNPPFDVSPDDRLSNEKIRITQIQNGRWTTVSDFIGSPL